MPAGKKRPRLPRERSGSIQKPGELAARIARTLEEDIVLGYIQPQHRLVEDELMARFEAKRHVVRQALTVLERLGVVERRPNRGAAVIHVAPAEVREIYEVREILEVAAAARIALPARREVIEQLATIQRRHDEALKARDLRSAFRINIEFHRALFGACGNACLAEVIDRMGQKAHVIRSFWMSRDRFLGDPGKEHWEIIGALKNADRVALVRLCKEHIAHAKNAYIEAYRERFPDSELATGRKASEGAKTAAIALSAS